MDTGRRRLRNVIRKQTDGTWDLIISGIPLLCLQRAAVTTMALHRRRLNLLLLIGRKCPLPFLGVIKHTSNFLRSLVWQKLSLLRYGKYWKGWRQLEFRVRGLGPLFFPMFHPFAAHFFSWIPEFYNCEKLVYLQKFVTVIGWRKRKLVFVLFWTSKVSFV